MTEQYSKNFSERELHYSPLADRLGIKNEPNEDQKMNLAALVKNVLQPLREVLGKTIVINSGFRSKELNKAIKGSKNSQHMDGKAADIECPGMSNYQLAKTINEIFVFDQLILEFYEPGIPNSGWVHVSYDRNGANRKQVLHIYRDKTTNKVITSPLTL